MNAFAGLYGGGGAGNVYRQIHSLASHRSLIVNPL
jgi:hypothetical protein